MPKILLSQFVETIMAMETIVIRNATESDCDEIYGMLKDMRVEQSRGHEFTITLEGFRRDGFGDKKLFETLAVEISGNKKMIGFATFYYGYSGEVGKMIFLEDIFLKKEERGKGHGTVLFKHVAKIGFENHSHRMVWTVFGEPDWTARAFGFYKKHGSVDCNIRALFLPLNDSIH